MYKVFKKNYIYLNTALCSTGRMIIINTWLSRRMIINNLFISIMFTFVLLSDRQENTNFAKKNYHLERLS